MLKTYLSDQGISVYRLSKLSHIPYSTLNDLINYKLPVENMKSGQLRSLADALSMDMNTLYDLCIFNSFVISEKHHVQARISIEHKTYYLSGNMNGNTFKREILPVKQEATEFLDILAKWKLDEILDGIAMEEAYEAVHS